MCKNPLKELYNRIYSMKSVILSLFLSGIIIIGTISPIFAYIPPTNAYSGIITSNDTVLAPNYFSNATFQGLHGIQVFGSNNSQTIYFNATLSNGTVITPITCSNNYQLHSVSSGGVFTCAPNNSTGGSGSTLDTMQNLTPAQAYVFARNNTNINFQFRGFNFTGSLSGSNSSNLITIHGNIYQNNTGSNLGTSGVGIFSSMSGSVLQFLKLIGGQGISVSSNSTNAIISTSFKVNNQTCAVGYFVSAYDNKTGNYICSQDSDPFLTSAVLSINGNTNAAQTINSSSPIVTTNSGAVHTLSCPTCNTRTNQGTYNTTQANNANINTSGYKINFINGTNNPVHVVNSATKNQVNITISTNAGTITGAQNIGHGFSSAAVYKSGTTPILQFRNVTQTGSGIQVLENTTDIILENTGVTSITGTTGNITASSSTGAVTLNIGNKIATLDSNGNVPASELGNSEQLIDSGTLSATAASWTINLGTVKHFMRIVLYTEWDGTGTGIDPQIQFNSDAGANYDIARTGENVGAAAASGQTGIAVFSSACVCSHYITGTVVNISASKKTFFFTSSGDFYSSITGGVWTNTSSQITSIKITQAAGTGKMTTNSAYFVYGHD